MIAPICAEPFLKSVKKPNACTAAIGIESRRVYICIFWRPASPSSRCSCSSRGMMADKSCITMDAVI